MDKDTNAKATWLALGLLVLTMLGGTASAQSTDQPTHAAITGATFVDIEVNKTGEIPYRLNVSSWGMEAHGSQEYLTSANDSAKGSFGVIFRWDTERSINTGERRWMECWGGQTDNASLEWVQVSLVEWHEIPEECRAEGRSAEGCGCLIGSVDAPYRFQLNPYDGPEVFDHYDRVTVAVFPRIEQDLTAQRVVEQFDVRPSDWDDWREDAGLASVTTQSASPPLASTLPAVGIALGGGLAAMVGILARQRFTSPRASAS